MKVAIIGAGVIGGGWAARFLLNGWDVSVYDPKPDSPTGIDAVMKNARRSLPALYDFPLPDEGNLTQCGSLEEAVKDADWIQESAPEKIDIKQSVFKQIQRFAPKNAVLGSSTSGFKPSQLQTDSTYPEQIIVTHPFNPVYLLPLVEVVPSERTSTEITTKAKSILADIGMKPLVVRKEIDAHIADRFLEAVWREGLWLINDNVATTEEIDDSIRYGFGLRWAQMGLFETYRLAGGELGMKHFIAQFGPALKWPWTKLMDVPELNGELIDKISNQSDAQSGKMSIRELERLRDDNLVGILRSLKKTGSGAGGTINRHEGKLELPRSTELPVTLKRQVPSTWTDYNGHMNEAHYLDVAGQATDKLMHMVGCDANYIASGKSYFTVETHIRHLNEVKEGQSLSVTTQVMNGTGKKMHLFHRIIDDTGKLSATAETLLLHVDLKTRRSSQPSESVGNKLQQLELDHKNHGIPDGAGRYVGQSVSSEGSN